MATDENRPVDPERAVELLWGDGRRDNTGLNLVRIVATAVELADADGLAALSMRRIAERLGYTTMSLYRHVPGKAELVDLMRDAVYAEVSTSVEDGASAEGGAPAETGAGVGGGGTAEAAGWRAGLAAWARENRARHRRHRWLVDSVGSRNLPGPNIMADYERALAVAERTGLPPAEVCAVVDLVGGFVQVAARQEAERVEVEQRTGESHEQWWGERDSLWERLDDYPVLRRLWSAGGYDRPVDVFEFGLARVLDGIELLITARGGPSEESRDEIREESRVEKRSARCVVCGVAIPEPGRGRPRSYCSRGCQQRAYRRRHAGV